MSKNNFVLKEKRVYTLKRLNYASFMHKKEGKNAYIRTS